MNSWGVIEHVPRSSVFLVNLELVLEASSNSGLILMAGWFHRWCCLTFIRKDMMSCSLSFRWEPDWCSMSTFIHSSGAEIRSKTNNSIPHPCIGWDASLWKETCSHLPRAHPSIQCVADRQVKCLLLDRYLLVFKICSSSNILQLWPVRFLLLSSSSIPTYLASY